MLWNSLNLFEIRTLAGRGRKCTTNQQRGLGSYGSRDGIGQGIAIRGSASWADVKRPGSDARVWKSLFQSAWVLHRDREP